MSLQFYIKDSNEAVIIEEKPFASGGEGALHLILSPARFVNHVAKIFHPHKRKDQQREAKINYLIENRPEFEYTPGHDTIIWVEKALYDEKSDFAGFIMPKASGEKLEILCAPKLPKHLGKDWKRLSFSSEEALKLRMKVCYNIASAIHQIHASGKYVLVDLKPDNIVIYPNGLVSIVDTDSFEVIENGKTLFPATVATPEYTPSEYYEGIRPGEVTIQNTWDRFSLAVIFYRILFGIHPFAASAVPPYDNLVSLGDKIHHGLYVHHPHKNEIFSIIPPPHRKFDQLEEELKILFQKTFIEGHDSPEERISAEHWASAFISSPYLIVDRPLPSKILNLENTVREDWYNSALEKALREFRLESPVRSLKTMPAASQTLLTEIMGSYGKTAGVALNVFKFIGLVLIIVTVMITVLSVFSGSGTTVFSVFGNLLTNFFYFGVGLITNPIVLILLTIPFLGTLSKKVLPAVGKKVGFQWENLRKNLAFNDDQKKRILEDKQYALFSKRVKLKQKLQEIKTELNIIDQVKLKKEENYQREFSERIKTTNNLIRSEIGSESEKIKNFDQKAAELMKSEAAEIKTLRSAFLEKLKKAPFSEITGNSPEQKIINLESWKLKQRGSELDIELEARALQLQLEDMRKQLDAEISAIRTKYDALHRALEEEGMTHKIKIDSLIEDATKKIRIDAKLDTALLDKKYKKLLKSRNELLLELYNEEDNMDLLNEEIKEVRDELNKLR